MTVADGNAADAAFAARSSGVPFFDSAVSVSEFGG
jgi:hypothetical protein